MPRKNKKRINIRLFECLVILGVLTGLFFSNAEGIQLLPFPDEGSVWTSENVTTNSFEVSERYNPAVQTSRSAIDQNSKLKRSDIAPASDSEAVFDLSNTISVEVADISYRSKTFHNELRHANIVPRGPPAV